MHLQESLQYIRDTRKPILFLGAGFSLESKNLNNQSTPTSNMLVKYILKHLNLTEHSDVPLSMAIDLLREKLTINEAHTFLLENLQINQLTETQLFILNLPWHRIYTTNIDNIGEIHFPNNTHDASDAFREVSKGDFVSLHGCLSNTTPANYYQKVKMGEQMYVSGSHSQTKYHDLLKKDLFECDCCIVLGYGMGDENLSNLFFNSQDMLDKCFVFSGSSDPVAQYRISQIGTNTKLKSSDFATLVKIRPSEKENLFPSNVKVENNLFDQKEITQAERQNLLIFGRFDKNIARSDWAGNNDRQYSVARSVVNHIASLSGPILIVCHSHFGNGKTIVKEAAVFEIANSHKPVFTIDAASTKERLAEALESIPTGSTVFFEGNPFYVLDFNDVISDKSICFVLLIRTTTFKVAAPQIYKNYNESVTTFDLNYLNHEEVLSFRNFIEGMGFWPRDLRRKTRAQEIDLIKSNFGPSINAITLKIYENTIIKNTISDEYFKVSKNLTTILDQFIVNSYSRIIDLNVPSYLISEFQNIDYKSMQKLDGPLINVDSSGHIGFHNSIIAEFCMNEFFKKEDIIGAVVRFANFIGEHPAERQYRWIVRRFHRYWNLRRLLADNLLPLEVFDRSSHIPSVASDPLFWVQYSISQMENTNFIQAGKFIEQAYSKAEKMDASFDTYQIDTHSAKLVVREIRERGFSDGFGNRIVRATQRLSNVIMRRPDDSYHIANVIVEIFGLEIEWRKVLTKKEYSDFCSSLKIIENVLSKFDNNDTKLQDEKTAYGLINKFLIK